MQKRGDLQTNRSRAGRSCLSIVLLILSSTACGTSSPYIFDAPPQSYMPDQTGNITEYNAAMNDIYTIWGTKSLSECDRWRAVNVLLETRVDSYMIYPDGVERSDWDSNDIVYYSTGEAVQVGLMSKNDIDYSVKYSTVQICEEGKDLKFSYEVR